MKLSTKDYLKKIAKTANKEVGYPCGKGKYFLGSLPVGTLFQMRDVKGVLLSSAVNAQVLLIDSGKTIWSWNTEVTIIKLGEIPEGEKNGDTLD